MILFYSFGVFIGLPAALNAIRIFKILSYLPVHRKNASVYLKSWKLLEPVMIYIACAIAVFAVIGTQIYMGVLHQYCVKSSDPRMR